MKQTLTGMSLALLLVGAGCSANTSINTTDDNAEDNNAMMEDHSDDTMMQGEEEAMTEPAGPVAFSTVGKGLMSAKFDNTENPTGYTTFDFTNGTGTCVDEGLTDFSYTNKNDFGYFAIVKNDGSYAEKWTSLDFTGEILFNDFPLTSGVATKCSILTERGSDTASATCMRDDKPVCTANYTLTASK